MHKRTPFLGRLLGVVGCGVALSLSFGGCTTLLGDFTVSETPGGGGGDACSTICNGQCVDLTSNAQNCGACGQACAGGQTCQASKCACPDQQAFCNGQCGKADRTRCGATCSPCQDDEICGDSCVTAPPPEFASAPRTPTGWTDSAGAPIKFEIKPTGVVNTFYECRTGPAASFTPTVPEWKPCDGGNGSGTSYAPTSDAATPQGTYRTEYRYRSDTYRSPTIAHVYYAHHQLDGVATCPRAGQANDGPHFTDEQYFNAAQTFSGSFPGQFPINETFPAVGAVRADPFYLTNPFIKIPFTNVVRLSTMGSQWPNVMNNFTVEERSLRHSYVVNTARNLLLVKRQYVNPVKKDCKNTFTIGNERGGDDTGSRGPNFLTFGPAGAGRGAKDMDCEALVLNARGMGLCIGPNSMGQPAPLVVDTRANPGFNTVTTVSGAAGSTSLTNSSATGFNFVPVGYHIQVPTGQYFPAFKWHRVTVAGNQTVQVTPPLAYAVPAGSQWRYYYQLTNLQKIYVIPTAFAKLYGNTHTFNAHAPFTPSPGTKCETPGCDAGKAWMTFLPP